MGNCLRTSKVSSQDHDDDYEINYEAPFEAEVVERTKTCSSSSSSSVQEQSMKKKKVRFSTQKGDLHSSDDSTRSGTVRIRVVMTQEELKRILSCNDDSNKHNTTLEQLLSAVKLRGGRVSEVGQYDDDDRGISSWRPALQSIPEDCLIN